MNAFELTERLCVGRKRLSRAGARLLISAEHHLFDYQSGVPGVDYSDAPEPCIEPVRYGFRESVILADAAATYMHAGLQAVPRVVVDYARYYARPPA